MNAEQWQLAKELIGEALRRPSADRLRFVHESCDDEQLRGEVCALLESASDVDVQWLLDSHGVLTENGGGSRVDRTQPAVSGYTLGRRLGEGGMGVVYEAEQEHPRRPVALKVIRGGAFASDLAVKLFHREAQALARLKHPDIGAIYHAGRTDDGQHFFAMELIGGVQLLEYARGLQGTARSILLRRLDVFCRIGRAVAYAHQRGVIHRDLKPSNILVIPAAGDNASWTATAEQVKILDFGLARITDPDEGAASFLTPGIVAGTLPYMSPEQARGNSDEVDVRTDVYALGAIVYEMLTGTVPCDVTGKPLPEAVRIICEQPPPRPDRLAVGHGSSVDRGARLDPDLVTIVLKALRKEPVERYQSVSALVEDIERYLRNAPILAHPPSPAYQFRKLVSRHKAPFAFAASFIVMIAAFGVTMAAQASRIARERDRALAAESRALTEADSARRVSEFMIDIFNVSNPSESKGATVTAREILDRAGTEALALRGDPLVHASLTEAIGRVYHNLGLLDQSKSFFEDSLAKRRAALSPGHAQLATSLTNLGEVLTDKGEFARGEPLLREAFSVRERSVATSAAEAEDAAYTYESLGHLLYLRSEFEEAERMLRRGLEIRQTWEPGDHPEVADSMSLLAQTLTRRSNYDEAEKLFQNAIAMNRRLERAESTDFAVALSNLAEVHRSRGDIDRSLASLRESLALWRKLVGDSHPEVTKNLNNLSLLLQSKGEYQEAEALMRRVVVLMREQYGDRHFNYAIILRNLASLLSDTGRAAEANGLYQNALRIQREAFGDDHQEVAYTSAGFGRALARLGAYDRGERELLTAYPILLAKLGPDHRRTRVALEGLVELYERWRKPAEAAKHRDALAQKPK